MDRQPVVAGKFYPGDPEGLGGMLDKFFGLAREKSGRPTIAAMVPHAGYPYSGPVCGATLGACELARTVLLLGPNHTGMGASLSLWAEGSWTFPGGGLAVDEKLARAVLDCHEMIVADQAAHVQEHSLEVILPFLNRMDSETTIVPLNVSARSPEILMEVGLALAGAIRGHGSPVSIVVSSDMSHYVSRDRAKELDEQALSQVVAMDPQGLYDTVRGRGISMCGVLPMTVALAASVELGAKHSRVVAYQTSGDVTGDYDQVVGYAGAIID